MADTMSQEGLTSQGFFAEPPSIPTNGIHTYEAGPRSPVRQLSAGRLRRPLREKINPNDVSSRRRARELYKYFHPYSFESSIHQDDGADQLLTSLAQLVAVRLGGKCLINFLDDSKQYIVAEATGIPSTDQFYGVTNLTQDLNDLQWPQCRGSDDIHNSVCQTTVRLAYTNDKAPLPYFEVLDLLNDKRFASIPLVTGTPKLRYYCGTPLYSRSGVAIGALVVIDTVARTEMSENSKQFLHSTAKNVMKLLEMHRESREQKRSAHMNNSLSRFVGAGSVGLRSQTLSEKHGSRKSSAADAFSRRPSEPTLPQENSFDGTTPFRSHVSSPSKPGPQTDTPLGLARPASSESAREADTFQAGADTLREALGSDFTGVTFLDTVAIKTPSSEDGPAAPRRHSPKTSKSYAGNRRPSMGTGLGRRPSADAATSSYNSGGSCPVLASSKHLDPPAAHSEALSDLSFTLPPQEIRMSSDTLDNLIGRYDSGMLWVFEAEGNVSFDAETLTLTQQMHAKKDGLTLLEQLPNATCIFFKPIWNARSDRYAVALAYSESQYQVFTQEQDVPFINALLNCVTVELVRLATAASDEQKSDFISTISHELRSPLHGILASCDLLADSDLSSGQDKLVSMVGSCGRTLLDTLSMVLDWSKVNAFERDWKALQSSRRGSRNAGPKNKRNHPLTQAKLLPSLYGHVDLAAVVEEVVEGVVVGQSVHAVDFADMGPGARGRDADRGFHHKTTRRARQPTSASTKPMVEVILDVAKPVESWIYLTQPGAFRRAIMNLVGNALKYTREGTVRVQMFLQASAPGTAITETGPPLCDNVVLIVEDSGKGISPEYLRSKAFSPFSQEDSLAAGTGLGLSLTKSILDMLEGKISIESTVGQGTTVTVTIPMLPRSVDVVNPSQSPSNTPSTADTMTEQGESVFDAVTRSGRGRRMAYYNGSVTHGTDQGEFKPLRASLEGYICAWFGLEMPDWSARSEIADLILTDDVNFDHLIDELKSINANPHWPSIVVLCSSPIRFQNRLAGQNIPGKVELVAKPFGPLRLARALQSCLSELSSAMARNGYAQSSTKEPTVHDSRPGSHATSGHLLTGLTVRTQSNDGIVVLNDDSTNAYMVMRSPPSSSSTAFRPDSPEMSEYPFPTDGSTSTSKSTSPCGKDKTTSSTPSETTSSTTPTNLREAQAQDTDAQKDHDRPTTAINHNTTSTAPKLHLGNLPLPVPIPHSQPSSTSTITATATTSPTREARILLVDDNAINLRLLQTYMTKLSYHSITLATDGRQASDAFREALDQGEKFDIVFMDLSMPVLDGFDATAEIRTLESRHNYRLARGLGGASEAVTAVSAPCMIVALTGLASEKDQSRAFEAGVDLYMTKPASFREVGRLMGGWERGGGVSRNEGAPNGALTAQGAGIEGVRVVDLGVVA